MKYLKVFTDFAEAMESLGDAERGRLFTAMLNYAETSEVPNLRGNERFLWSFAKTEIDRQRDSYNRRCETNQRIATNRHESLPRATNRNETLQDKDKDEDKGYIPPVVPQGDERFEEFWEAYPKKVGKDAARAAFRKRRPSQKLLDDMLHAISVQTKSEQWTRESGRFIPNPATWINQGRWQDDVRIAARNQHGYEEHNYSDEELNALLIDLDQNGGYANEH